MTTRHVTRDDVAILVLMTVDYFSDCFENFVLYAHFLHESDGVLEREADKGTVAMCECDSTVMISDVDPSPQHSDVIARTLQLKTSASSVQEVQDVADKTEKILRVLTYSLLEAMMHEVKCEISSTYG